MRSKIFLEVTSLETWLNEDDDENDADVAYGIDDDDDYDHNINVRDDGAFDNTFG